MNSLISVIVPCYNQADYLEETLISVLNQTYANWECIIVNDGSTDKTEEIAQKWLNHDDRFIYYYKENGGLSSARNFGIKKAKGVYLQFLDSDDLIIPDKFESQINDLYDFEISVCDYFPFDDTTGEFVERRYLSPHLSPQKFKEEIISEWEYRKSIPCHTVLFSKKIISDNAIEFNEDLENHEDWVFWVMLFYFAKSYTNNSKVLAKYRIRSNSMSVQKSMFKGFVTGSKLLIDFFITVENRELRLITIEKKDEIYSKNKKKQNFLKNIIRRIIRF